MTVAYSPAPTHRAAGPAPRAGRLPPLPDALAARLADHHPVQVVDLPGFGLSGDPGRVLDVAEHADHLAAWLQAAGLPAVAVLGNSFGCQVAVDLAMRHPDRVGGLVLVGPTMDPTARTAPRQILRWLGDTAREDPLQLPILVRDVHDAGPRRVVGTLAHALRDPIEDKLPWSGRRRWSRGAAPRRSCPWPGHRPLPGCSR